jgi:hypothetical protein
MKKQLEENEKENEELKKTYEQKLAAAEAEKNAVKIFLRFFFLNLIYLTTFFSQ